MTEQSNNSQPQPSGSETPSGRCGKHLTTGSDGVVDHRQAILTLRNGGLECYKRRATLADADTEALDLLR